MPGYGYYLAWFETEHGEAHGLRERWESKGLDANSQYDGVARLPDGTIRFVARDVFREKFACLVHDERA